MLELDKNNKNDVTQSTGTVQEAGTASLGILAKSTTPPINVDVLNESRRKRFSLLSSIRKCYLLEGEKEGLDIPHKFHRTTNCKHSMVEAEVHLHQNKTNNRAFYTGLQTCGSVWTCPVCANKIQEVRRLEIAHAMRYFYNQGKQAVMVTFTFPHNQDDPLKPMLDAFANALSALKSGEPWNRFKNKFGFDGLIRSLEITHGVNGWHPHTHELFFINNEIDEEKFKEWIIERWFNMCSKYNLIDCNDTSRVKAFLSHSVDFKFNCSTSDYLAKFDDKSNWGADREMAKASTKQGRLKGKHPFELAHQNYYSLFIEYTKAIKKKRQLFFSKGLKEKVGLQDLEDGKVAELEDKDVYIGSLNKNYWHIVTKKDLRCDVLELAEKEENINNIRSFIFHGNVKNE